MTGIAGIPNLLENTFLGFLREIHSFLEEGNLPNHWHPEVNLLDEKTPVVLENIANRLKRILNSEAEIDRILSSRINGESVMQETSSYISHLIVPVNKDGEMSTHQISIFFRPTVRVWTIAGVFKVCCCLYKFNVNFGVCCIILFSNIDIFCYNYCGCGKGQAVFRVGLETNVYKKKAQLIGQWLL